MNSWALKFSATDGDFAAIGGFSIPLLYVGYVI